MGRSWWGQMVLLRSPALGFWKALREVFPQTDEQRCWFQQANVLAALWKSAHHGAIAAMKDIYNAEDIEAQIAIKAFEIHYSAKYPKAVANHW